MTKGSGQKHYQPSDHKHDAHQEAERDPDHNAMQKIRPIGRGRPGKGSAHPVEQPPKSPRRDK